MRPSVEVCKLHHPPRVLHNVQLRAEPGQQIAVRGANGSGKTTLIKLCVGLWRIRSGSVTICGHPAGSVRARQVVAWMPDQPVLPALRTDRLLQAAAAMHGCPATQALDALADLDGSTLLRQRADRLSAGQARRVALALALARPPQVLFADEPLANLDEDASARVKSTFERLLMGGCTIIYTTPTGSALLRPDDTLYDLAQGKLAVL